MSKWETVNLVDVCKLNMGQSPDSSSYNQEATGMPFYQGNADFGELHPQTRYYCNKPTKIAHAGDILLSVRAPIGALNIANDTCCIGRGLAALTVNNRMEMKFLYHVLKTKTRELNQKGTGSTFKAINKQTLSEVQIPLPPLPIQKKIAATLDTAMENINLRQQQLAEIDNLVKSRFVEMFGDPVTNPIGWEVKPLGEVSDCFIGLTYKPEDITDNGTIVLRSGNIQNGELDFADIIRVKTEIRERLYVKPGDILMCSRNGSARLVGKTALIPILDEDMTFGAFMTIIRSKYSDYLLQFFRSEAFGRQITTAKTSTINQITKSMLDNINLPLPPLELQNQFTDFVKAADKSKLEMKKAIKESQLLFKSLISNYFD